MKVKTIWQNPYPINTHGHDDDQAGGDVGVKQVVSQSSLQDEDHLQASKVPRRIDLSAIGGFVADQGQLGQLYVPVHHQRLFRVPLEDQIIRCVGH